MKSVFIILLMGILIEFICIVEWSDRLQETKDQKIQELLIQKVDSMRTRNQQLFLLSLKLNNITNRFQSSKREKEKDPEIKELFIKLQD